jgi:hypothetical protein
VISNLFNSSAFHGHVENTWRKHAKDSMGTIISDSESCCRGPKAAAKVFKFAKKLGPTNFKLE